MTMREFFVAGALALVYVVASPALPVDGSPAALAAGARAIGHGRFDVGDTFTDPRFTEVHGGQRRITLPIGAQLALVPAALVETLAGRWVPRAEHALSVEHLGQGLAALCVIFICLRLGRRLERDSFSPSTAAGVALLLGLGTSMVGAARGFDGVALSTLCLYLALEQTLDARPLRAGLAFGALLLVDPGYFAATLVATIWHVWRRRSLMAAPLMGVPILAGLALALWYRRTTGAWADTGSVTEGVVGLVWSTGKGLFTFHPILWALPWAFGRVWSRRDPRTLVALVSVAAVLVIAAGARWHADPSYGPTRLMPLVPWLLLLVAGYAQTLTQTRLLQLTMAVLIASSLCIQLFGVVVRASDWDRLATRVAAQTGAMGWFADPQSQVHFIPQFSPLVGHPFVVRRWLSHEPATVPGKPPVDVDVPWHLLLPQAPSIDAEVAKLSPDIVPMRGWLRAIILVLAAALTILALRRRAATQLG